MLRQNLALLASLRCVIFYEWRAEREFCSYRRLRNSNCAGERCALLPLLTPTSTAMSGSAARSYSSAQSRGSAVSELLNPVKGYRDSLVRRGIQPRNHAKENMASLRRLQQTNRDTKDRNAGKGDNRFVMKRFRGVASRVEVTPGAWCGGVCSFVWCPFYDRSWLCLADACLPLSALVLRRRRCEGTAKGGRHIAAD